MKKIVFIGSHLGYAMEKTPLGGGAMVGMQLVRHWSGRPGFGLVTLGSGPVPPHPGSAYVQMRTRQNAGARKALVDLSELGYARFCREFEAASTEWVLSREEEYRPSQTCVVVNDISEGPTLQRLVDRGYRVVSLWHVDVVDYFNKLYLRQLVPAHRLTRMYERSRRFGGRRLLPDMLRLVFEKQRETVLHSRRMIMPSRLMARTVERCYSGILKNEEFNERALVVPWGMWREGVSAQAVADGAQKLRAHFQIGPETTVLMTLSRISPEKGLHILLEALRRLETDPRLAGKDLCLFVCGEPAFMQGAAYGRRVRKAAAGLKRFRIFFPGYVSGEQKQAYFQLADLFISPSIHESYGLNIVEAMQAGLGILASDHYGVQELLLPAFGKIAGYSSLRKAPGRLAEALAALLADPAALAEMGRQAAKAAAAMPFSGAADTVLEAALGVVQG